MDLAMRLFIFFWLLAFNAHATMVFPSKKEVSLQERTAAAHVAFKGTCIEKKLEKVKGVRVHVFTFKVEEVLKGDVGDFYVVRQSGARSREEASKLGVPRLHGFHFKQGQKYLLFLGEPRQHGIQPVLGGPKRLAE